MSRRWPDWMWGAFFLANGLSVILVLVFADRIDTWEISVRDAAIVGMLVGFYFGRVFR